MLFDEIFYIKKEKRKKRKHKKVEVLVMLGFKLRKKRSGGNDENITFVLKVI